MFKVLNPNTVNILCKTTRTPQQIRDVFKISCNYATKPNSPSTDPAKIDFYTFRQSQKDKSKKVSSYGWIMLVRKFASLRLWDIFRYFTVNSSDNIWSWMLANTT